MKSRSPGSVQSPRFTPTRVLLMLCVVGLAHLIGNLGCSSGTICYRNTDCPYASDCKQGQCVRRTAGSGVAGSGSVDTSAAGEADMSQTPDAN